MNSFHQIILLIEARKFDEAMSSIKLLSQKDTEYFGYKGLIHFHKEEYSLALENFTIAISNNEDEKWKYFYEICKQNVHSSLNEYVPDVYFFSAYYLEKLHTNSANKFDIKINNSKTSGTQLNQLIGSSFGYLSSVLMNGLTSLYGNIAGYKDKYWTNWYRKKMFTGVLTLAYMRNQLNKLNLFNTYTINQKINNNLKYYPPTEFEKRFRTINGTYNNFENIMEGAAGTRFQRNVNAQSSNKTNTDDLLNPNPRTISQLLLTRKGEMIKAPFVNMLAAAWIQFQNHDWISHGEPSTNEVIEIPVGIEDEIFKKFHQRSILVGKTQHDITRDESEQYQYTFINEVTHWWDGSQIYGSDIDTSQKLRTFQNGKLKIKPDGTLPLDNNGIELTGYTRNWWVGLTLMHTLFVKEHNSICEELILHNEGWCDEQLFQTARLINAALMAKIHTLEWNSAINPNKIIFNGNHSNWYGFLTTLLHKKEDWKTIANINLTNTELGGVVGNPINKHGGDYGLTQEFVEAYRIHSMLPEELILKDHNSKKTITQQPFSYARQKGSSKMVNEIGLENLFYSLGTQNPGQVVLNNYPTFMQQLTIPGNPVYDMGAVDILRARERGVPRYNEFRRQLGLNPLSRFEDLTSDIDVIETLKNIYGKDDLAIERLDFMIGTLAEEHRPTGFAFGETMFHLFLLNATRRLQADRFYTDCYTEEFYTKEGLTWIDKNTMKSVLLRHFPSLKNTGLKNVSNAFEPWDEELPLDKNRHPSMEFDVK